MKIAELVDYVLPMAREFGLQNEFGALHIVVSDANLDDDNIEFCLRQKNITPEEKDFARRLLENYTLEQRGMIWEFSTCEDIATGGHHAR